jgi:hypothetical protein
MSESENTPDELAPTKRKAPRSAFVKGDPRINRTGRPKGFGQYIRSVTGESGEKLFKIAWMIARGAARADDYVTTKTGKAVPVRKGPSIRERLDAVKFLAEHGFGKPQASIHMTGTVEHVQRMDLSRLTEEQMAQLDALVGQVSLEDGETVEGEVLAVPAALEPGQGPSEGT